MILSGCDSILSSLCIYVHEGLIILQSGARNTNFNSCNGFCSANGLSSPRVNYFSNIVRDLSSSVIARIL